MIGRLFEVVCGRDPPVRNAPSKEEATTDGDREMANAQSGATTQEGVRNGMIHVRVLRAIGLPTMDYGKRQDPFVLVQLEGSDPMQWASTDPAFQGGQTPEWTEQDNNELEVFYDATQQNKHAILTVEVYADELGEDLIGTGQVNVTDIVENQTKTPKDVTVRLKDGLSGSANRGEVSLQIWYGPAIRKAFRAAQRASKLLDARDSFVATVYAIIAGGCGSVCKYFQLPSDFVKKHRKISMALAACLGIVAAGAAAIFLMIAVPTAVVAALTLPFWIIPFLVTSFFTAPVWIPIVVVIALFFGFISTFFLGLGVTSRPVRRKGSLWTTKLKHSDVGKRVVYEKEA
ncbi:TPA: hypothetical protein N0F65_007721 [Lagenidium giganteum]|uniref:C2 domain-containing protein n=1 Tax=Lagenidium giganteum TaxID=4803 RepID=A0AAV2Z1P8_9STRA|nr:TPA: hypothetical protein N0F65_007721 [Lagenidium giganteum]